MKTYNTIFFDLDRTIWDFDTNSKNTLQELIENNGLSAVFGSFEEFYNIYKKVNDSLWAKYRDGKIEKEILSWKRFYDTFLKFGLDDIEIAKIFGLGYVSLSPTKTKLFPHSHEVLEYLENKYTLYIITNGFSEVQYEKIKNCRLGGYFSDIFTSEEIGVKKPDAKIFNHAVEISKTKRKNCLMIGDDLNVDIIGARRAGIDQVFFNFDKIVHTEKVTFEISSLIQLKEIL
ncbi:MAG: noncanonical pyrimidine nucleotidase, YjjG family [Bacteroidetes bacterium]|jgi:putative hydrolase of the HAD superfamily|nr:noncanonical pyrimidine nucleotidase, YjjG family [Bacteroidota bacterium]MBT6685096.1 noncanonical pyrimidine nucleotidase, YjjG family [Bacteroidota bacterium]MBT7141939.1 noncanonical pyrimidine nucleotidase, YjjG family [Bacteroidota bacterium]MBT7491176.1 noncanonical pyrimidine nucleotidase, YjjG family [Bacteroidota bacterium]